MSNDTPIERLQTIATMIEEALSLADDNEEFMLGAKLSDCLRCVHERIESLSPGT